MSTKIRALFATGFTFILMALAAQTGNAQTAITTGDPAPLVTEVTSQNLGQTMDHSRTRPLVMVFSNCNCGKPDCPICNPTRKALEELVLQDNGDWLLATVDLKANPELATRFEVADNATTLAVVKNVEVTAKEAAPAIDTVARWVHEKIA